MVPIMSHKIQVNQLIKLYLNIVTYVATPATLTSHINYIQMMEQLCSSLYKQPSLLVCNR
jgi:hypothetical protein